MLAAVGTSFAKAKNARAGASCGDGGRGREYVRLTAAVKSAGNITVILARQRGMQRGGGSEVVRPTLWQPPAGNISVKAPV